MSAIPDEAVELHKSFHRRQPRRRWGATLGYAIIAVASALQWCRDEPGMRLLLTDKAEVWCVPRTVLPHGLISR